MKHPPPPRPSPWLLIDLRIVAFQLRQHEASSTGFFVGPCQTLPPTFHRAYEIKVNYSVSANFSLELTEPSAREVEGHQYF